MKLPIVRIGFPALRRACRPVPEHSLKNAEFSRFLKSMVQTMRGAQGVGLAANQVGVDLRAIVLECRASRRYPEAPSFPLQHYVNPRIVKASRQMVTDWEGCLSIPGYRGLVPRHASIVVEAVRPDGHKMRRRVSGFEARVFQHEIDHINGKVYVDRMPDMRTLMHEDEMTRLARQARRKSKSRHLRGDGAAGI
jgi:peptide deformylase